MIFDRSSTYEFVNPMALIQNVFRSISIGLRPWSGILYRSLKVHRTCNRTSQVWDSRFHQVERVLIPLSVLSTVAASITDRFGMRWGTSNTEWPTGSRRLSATLKDHLT